MTWWRTDAQTWEAHGWRVEVRADELAEIRRDGRILLRAVRAVVRDRGWQTVPVTVCDVDVSAETLILRLSHVGLSAHLESRLEVRAGTDELMIAWDADNQTVFDTCRTGLVVLHPASDGGSEALVEHPDGSIEITALPVEISPHQPIRNIRELRITGGPALRFAGEVFEMEDQRNWTDASFKTYSRPLELPYPYRLEAGEHVRQSIRIRADDIAEPVSTPEATIELHVAGVFPEIGVEASTAPDLVPASDIGMFRVVELDLATPNWRAALARAAADARPLDVRIVADCEADALVEAAHALRGHDVVRVTAFDRRRHVSTGEMTSALRRALATAHVGAAVLAGSRSHFTELNREQEAIPRDVAGITVNTTPLFHSLDTEQLVESLAMQRLIAQQTVRIAAGAPVHIGPISLRPRYNNVATTPTLAPLRTDLSQGHGAQFTGAKDDRQGARELAAWVIASAAALAVAGVESLSWFETWGPRGLIDASGRTPAAAALKALAALSGGTLLTGDSPDGLVWALGSRREDGNVVLVANLDRADRQFTVRAPGGTEAVMLGAGSWTRAPCPELFPVQGFSPADPPRPSARRAPRSRRS